MVISLPASSGPAHSRLSETRRAELLDVAAEVFFEQGFQAASVGEMARRARASKETFYSRYPTKDKLFLAVMHRRADGVENEFRGILSTDQEMATALQTLGREFLAIILSEDSIRLRRIVWMEAYRIPSLRQVFYEIGRERMIDRIAAYLEAKTRQGMLAVIHFRITAEQLLDSLIGDLLRRAMLGIEGVTTRERNLRVKIAVEAFLLAYRPAGKPGIKGTAGLKPRKPQPATPAAVK